jgi:hypothetical protein
MHSKIVMTHLQNTRSDEQRLFPLLVSEKKMLKCKAAESDALGWLDHAKS